jgi:hypothetical protein
MFSLMLFASVLVFTFFISIQMPLLPGCTLRKHLWDVQAQFALPVEIVGSILATLAACLVLHGCFGLTLAQL